MERRSLLTEIRGTGNTLLGYGAVFDSPTVVRENGRTFREVIKPGAFAKALSSGGDIIATFNHDVNRLLGRTSAGTLRLSEDDRGLRFELDLPDHAADVREMVERGDLRGASFTFSPRKGGEAWADGTRFLHEVFLYELGPVVMPQYSDTSVALRSKGLLRLRLMSREKI